MLFGKYINRYYLRYAPILLLGLAALVAVDYFQLIVPELYRMVINGVNEGVVTVNGRSLPFNLDFLLEQICRPMIFIVLIMVVGRFTWRICFFGSAVQVETSLRAKMFDHAEELSTEFYQVSKVGNLMSLFTNDLDTVQECFGDGVLMFFDALMMGLLALWKMLNMNLFLTGLTLIPLALLLVMGTIVGKAMTRKWEVRQEAFSDLSDFSQEIFSGIAVVKAFVKETVELTAFRWLNRKNEEANVEYTRISTLLNVLVTLFVESVVCVILGYGGWLVHEGVFSAGELVEFIGYFNSVVWPVMAISMLIEMHSRGKASLNRIQELLDRKPDVVDAPDVTDVTGLSGKIRFQNLTFSYPGAAYPSLENVSFTIEAGESVGIIGRTGSGKSTLVDLILRTYNVPKGTIWLDDQDITKLPIRTVRNFCAYVPQDNFLFSDTIEKNIAFAVDEENFSQVEEAAKVAELDENIRGFQAGYQTILGERGVTVSGGQKQRISIARAILKKAPILILDDSVSAVDVRTEKNILENLKRIRKGGTTLLIAHRVSTVEQMDKILFLDGGKVVDMGTHEELYNRCPAYHSMVELQRIDDTEA